MREKCTASDFFFLAPLAGSRRTKLALIPTVAAIDSRRHPWMSAIALTREVRALRCTCTVGRASKDGNMNRLAAILRGPRKERGHLRVNAIAFIPGMTVIVWCRWYQSSPLIGSPTVLRISPMATNVSTARMASPIIIALPHDFSWP